MKKKIFLVIMLIMVLIASGCIDDGDDDREDDAIGLFQPLLGIFIFTATLIYFIKKNYENKNNIITEKYL